MMERYLVIIRNLICTTCAILLFWGCDRSADPTAKPKVIRKKIMVEKIKTTAVSQNKMLQTAKTTQIAKQNQNIPKQKAQITRAAVQPQPAAKTGATEQTLIAKETNPIQTPTQKALLQPKKPAVKPKSDISQITEPVKIKEPQVGNELKTVAEPGIGDNLIASTAVVAQTPSVTDGPPIYDPTGKLDPFEPLYQDKPVAVKKKQKKRIPQTPLERIDLSQLKLVGIILASSGNRALVEETTGKGYVIKTGTYIGTNSGKVVKIQKDKVIVEEEFEDVFGKIKTREKELKLPKPPGEF
jgi:type IV pilus assembly protein PilP